LKPKLLIYVIEKLMEIDSRREKNERPTILLEKRGKATILWD